MHQKHMASGPRALWWTRSKALSKGVESVKTSGYRKLSSAYSSCRLFCSGVPVSSSTCCRLHVGNDSHHEAVSISMSVTDVRTQHLPHEGGNAVHIMLQSS